MHFFFFMLFSLVSFHPEWMLFSLLGDQGTRVRADGFFGLEAGRQWSKCFLNKLINLLLTTVPGRHQTWQLGWKYMSQLLPPVPIETNSARQDACLPVCLPARSSHVSPSGDI